MKNDKLQKSVFKISKMDCPSEENLIKMKLNEISAIQKLDFDIPNRKLTVYHSGELELIENSIAELDFGDELLSNETTESTKFQKDLKQMQILWSVLAINFLFFIIEITTGLISKSMGLVADSLDMLADSFVYGLSLIAVGGTIALKIRIATIAGYFQIILALIGFVEVLRRFSGLELMPDYSTMIIVSILALIANSICLYLLQKSKSKEAHIQATMIFTSNDVIINLGVITAAIFVYIFKSNIPDLIIGAIVLLVVIRGANRILKLGK